MRNTYDNKVPYKGNNQNQESKERETYNSVQPKQSFQKPQMSTAAGNEKMSKNILEILKRLGTKDEKFAITSLKATQKTLFSVVSQLISSLDGAFDETNLNVQNIADLFKALGYPNTINKTYFQPVGAPHTWSQCLMMMEWIADLAAFHYDIKQHLEQGQFGLDFTGMLIDAYLNQDREPIKNYLNNEINRKQKLLEDYSYSIKTLNLSIDNLNTSQRDLPSVQEDLNRYKQILNRERQEVKQAEQQKNMIVKTIQDLQNKIKEQKRIGQIFEREKSLLKMEIQNQQMSVEQIDKIRFEIKEFQRLIAEKKRQSETNRQNFDKTDSYIINMFLEFQQTIEKIRQFHQAHKDQIQKRNIFIQVPVCETNEFITYLKDRSGECSEGKFQLMLATKLITEIRDKADVLSTIVQMDLNKMIQNRHKKQMEKNQWQNQTIENQVSAEQEQKVYESTGSELERLIQQSQQNKSLHDRIYSQITKADNQIKAGQDELNRQKEEFERIKKDSYKANDFLAKFQHKTNQMLFRMQQKLDQFKEATLKMMEEEYDEVSEAMRSSLMENGLGIYDENQNQQTFVEKSERKIENIRSDQSQNYDYYSYSPSLSQNNMYRSPPNQRINRLKKYEYDPFSSR